MIFALVDIIADLTTCERVDIVSAKGTLHNRPRVEEYSNVKKRQTKSNCS